MRISTNFSFRNQTRVTYRSFLQFTGCVARAKFPRLPLFLFQRNVIIGQRSIKMDVEEISSIFNMKKVNHNIQFDLKNEQILATMSFTEKEILCLLSSNRIWEIVNFCCQYSNSAMSHNYPYNFASAFFDG